MEGRFCFFFVVMMAAAMLLSACSQTGSDTTAPPPTAVPFVDSGATLETDTVSSTSSSTTTTTIATTTTRPVPSLVVGSPNAVAIVEVTEPAIAPSHPSEAAGVVADVTEGLGVITSPGEQLTVRIGPDTQFPAVDELDHRTTGLRSTHLVGLTAVEWRFIERDGVPLGWVPGQFLKETGDLSFCNAPPAMPAGLTPGSPVRVDIDGDAAPDTVAVFAEANRLWVRADLTSGGVVAGAIDGIAAPPASPELQVRRVANSASGAGFDSQFIVKTSEQPGSARWTAFTLDGCEIAPTTLDGIPFVFRAGDVEGANHQFGCIYGADNRFVTIGDAGPERLVNQYVLNGTEWTLVASAVSEPDPATGAFETPPGFTPCIQG